MQPVNERLPDIRTAQPRHGPAPHIQTFPLFRVAAATIICGGMLWLGGCSVDDGKSGAGYRANASAAAEVPPGFLPEDVFVPPGDTPPTVWLVGEDGERVVAGKLEVASWSAIDPGQDTGFPERLDWPDPAGVGANSEFVIQAPVRPFGIRISYYGAIHDETGYPVDPANGDLDPAPLAVHDCDGWIGDSACPDVGGGAVRIGILESTAELPVPSAEFVTFVAEWQVRRNQSERVSPPLGPLPRVQALYLFRLRFARERVAAPN